MLLLQEKIGHYSRIVVLKSSPKTMWFVTLRKRKLTKFGIVEKVLSDIKIE